MYWLRVFNVFFFYGGVYAIFKLIWLDFIAVALAFSTEFQHENCQTNMRPQRCANAYVCICHLLLVHI